MLMQDFVFRGSLQGWLWVNLYQKSSYSHLSSTFILSMFPLDKTHSAASNFKASKSCAKEEK